MMNNDPLSFPLNGISWQQALHNVVRVLRWGEVQHRAMPKAGRQAMPDDGREHM